MAAQATFHLPFALDEPHRRNRNKQADGAIK